MPITESSAEPAVSIAPSQVRDHIPRGVADYFWREAWQRRRLEARLLDLFRGWGYGDVIPPTFEYADTLSARSSLRLRTEMYRFLDRDGSTLALRPDMTIPVARLVGSRLHDWPMPQRFCYAGNVFRYAEPHAGRQREFLQAGVELVGASAAAADAEVLAVTAAALRAAGIHRFRLVIGQMAYFDGLLQELRLSPNDQQALLHAVDHNSEAELSEFLTHVPLRTQARRTLEELPFLNGDDPPAIIDRADRLCLNHAMHAALDNLRAIYSLLDAYQVADHAFLDLTEIRNLGYYTGMTFEVFTPQLGSSVAAGGRYDNLIGTFGRDTPAVGAALGIDRILLARSLQQRAAQRHGPGDAGSPVMPLPAHVMVAAGNSRACLRIVEEWRANHARVVVDVDGRAGAELWRVAQAVGVPFVVAWSDDAFEVYGPQLAEPPEPGAGSDNLQPRRVPASAQRELLTEILQAMEDGDGW